MSRTILGIDCGFSQPGAAVLEYRFTTTLVLSLVAVASLSTAALSKRKRVTTDTYKSDDDARRVTEISDWLATLVADHEPTHVVVELPSSGAKSSGAIRGMALGAACTVATFTRLGYRAGYLHFVTPGANKLASTGDRFAEKEAVFSAICRRFPDFSDWPTKPVGRGSHKTSGPDLEARHATADAASAVLAAVMLGKITPTS